MKKKKTLIRVLILSIITTCFLQTGVFSNTAIGAGSVDSLGDLNNDLAINMSDVMILANVFNSAIGSSKYTASYDLNSDGAINMSDVMIVAGNFNKTVTASPSTSTVKPTPTQTAKPTPIPTVQTTTKIDDWNYISATKSISIKKVQKGSGSTGITYYVADIKISDDSTILSAFGNNKFGPFGADTSAVLSKIATDNNAIFAINGDYYSFRKDGYEIRNGTLYRDVPIRDCLILYKNGLMETAYEGSISASTLLANGAFNVLSFGPVLVKSGVALTTFEHVPSDQGPTYLLQAHPRTGIGMIEPNHFIIIVVDGRTTNSAGMTMTEFAKTFADLGCKVAYNLDGGGSAEMYFNGRVINIPNGTGKERTLSDGLYIKK